MRGLACESVTGIAPRHSASAAVHQYHFAIALLLRLASEAKCGREI